MNINNTKTYLHREILSSVRKGHSTHLSVQNSDEVETKIKPFLNFKMLINVHFEQKIDLVLNDHLGRGFSIRPH